MTQRAKLCEKFCSLWKENNYYGKKDNSAMKYLPEVSNILENMGVRGNSAIWSPRGDVKLPLSSRAGERHFKTSVCKEIIKNPTKPGKLKNILAKSIAIFF